MRRWLYRIRRFRFRRREDWPEPALPPWVKINPESPPGSHDEGLQPGDISMAKVAEEFLDDDDIIRWEGDGGRW